MKCLSCSFWPSGLVDPLYSFWGLCPISISMLWTPFFSTFPNLMNCTFLSSKIFIKYLNAVLLIFFFSNFNWCKVIKKKRSFLIQLSPLNCLNINCVTENYHKHNVKIASLFQVLIDIEEKETSLNIIVRSLQLLLDYLTQYPKQPSML